MQTLNLEAPVLPQKHWEDLVNELGLLFEQNAEEHDLLETFVSSNYERLKVEKVFSLAIPGELGGGNLSHPEMCHFLNHLARHCGSTALALSMHQHLVAATIWKYRKKGEGEALLRKITEQQLVLVSTGAGDWLDSNGTMEKTDGGFFVTATKNFASQAPAGDILVSSARYKDPEQGWQVLHFSIPLKNAGVHIKENWHAMGMRGTGSHTVVLNEAFVPESAVALKRPAGEFHPVWGVVLTAAMPLIMSVYAGLAEKAAEIAVLHARKNEVPHNTYLLGEMYNELTLSRVTLNDMIRLANNLDFEPTKDIANEILMRKTLVAKACVQTVSKAMEICGGQGYLRATKLERLFRDVNAAHYHPLQEKAQHQFTGDFLLDRMV